MFSFLKREASAAGRVLYPGSIPPPLEQVLASAGGGITTRTLRSDHRSWSIEAHHPDWGLAIVTRAPHHVPLPEIIIDHALGLSSDNERARARTGEASLGVHVRTAHEHVLRGRKRLLFWMRFLMDAHGVVALDETSGLLWSPEMLDDELAHDADLDVEALYTIHAVREAGASDRVAWLHTHGLEEFGAFDVEVLAPSPAFVANCAGPIRALAFAALEGTIDPDTDRFGLAYPGGEVRLVPVDRFDREASPSDRRPRAGVSGHSGRRAVLCDVVGGPFRRWRHRPVPSRYCSRYSGDGGTIVYSEAATDLMADRARRTFDVLRRLKAEFESLALPIFVKLGYEKDGGEPNGREHLWFAVHSIGRETVEATLANTPHHVSNLKEGQRGEHGLDRLTDWVILSPEGSITPRNMSAARRLR